MKRKWLFLVLSSLLNCASWPTDQAIVRYSLEEEEEFVEEREEFECLSPLRIVQIYDHAVIVEACSPHIEVVRRTIPEETSSEITIPCEIPCVDRSVEYGRIYAYSVQIFSGDSLSPETYFSLQRFE